MFSGRCIDDDFGFMGCQSDQLLYLDKQCSGKQRCEVDVNSQEMGDNTDCAKSLTVFLDASFYCQKGQLEVYHVLWLKSEFIYTESFNGMILRQILIRVGNINPCCPIIVQPLNWLCGH